MQDEPSLLNKMKIKIEFRTEDLKISPSPVFR
jgi:hypothetical protein